MPKCEPLTPPNPIYSSIVFEVDHYTTGATDGPIGLLCAHNTSWRSRTYDEEAFVVVIFSAPTRVHPRPGVYLLRVGAVVAAAVYSILTECVRDGPQMQLAGGSAQRTGAVAVDIIFSCVGTHGLPCSAKYSTKEREKC